MVSNPVLDAAINPTGVFREAGDIHVVYPAYRGAPQIGPGSAFGAAEGTLFGVRDAATGQLDFSDFFTFTAPDDALSVVSLSLTSTAPDDVLFYVYDDDLFWGGFSGYVGGAFTLDASGERTLDFVPGLGESYYVYVAGGSGDVVDYRLELTADDAGSGDRVINLAGAAAGGDFPATPDEVFFGDGADSTLFDGEPLAGSLGGDDAADVFAAYAFLASEGRVLLDTAGGASVLSQLDERGNVISAVPIDANYSGTIAPYFILEDDFVFFELAPADPAAGLDYTISFDYLSGDGTSDYLVETDQRLEAGATAFSAPVLDLSSGVATVEGEIGFIFDERDLYRILVPEGGVLRVSGSGLGPESFLELYDDDGGFLASHRPAQGTLVSEFEATVSGPGEYFLNIENYTPATYTIDVELLVGAGGAYVPPPGSEDLVVDATSAWDLGDAGGSVGTAAFVALDGDGDRRIVGSAGGSDSEATIDGADFYRMVVPTGGLVSFALEGLSADLDLYLYDRAGALLASSIRGGASSENLVVELDRGEPFFLGVEPFAGAESDYTLTVDAPAPVAGQERSDTGLSPDAGGGPLTALLLQPSSAGDVYLEGSTVLGEDASDAFLFTAPASGRATFRLDGLFAAVEVEITNAGTGAQVLSTRTQDNESLWREFEVTAGDDYLLAVTSPSFGDVVAAAEGPTPYGLFLSLPTGTTASAAPDSIDGNSIGDASGLVPVTLDHAGDVAASGSVGFFDETAEAFDGRDEYLFTAEADGEARVVVSNLYDWVDVSVYDAVSFLTEVSGFDDQRVALSFPVVAGGEYVVEIADSGSSGTSYDLVIDVDFSDGIPDHRFFDPDGDGLLYDASIVLDDGRAIDAALAALYRVYAGALGRTPDDGGFDWWSEQIALGNHTFESMVAGFVFSEEFLSFFPDATTPDQISSEAFVTHMYENVFGREPDDGGFAFWTGELDSGNRSQAQVVVDMTQSNEFAIQTVAENIEYLI